jgi:predicted amidophosphoribosyltransferase
MTVTPKPVCRVCGKPSHRIICAACANQLNREALRNEKEDETHGKVLRPFLLH